MKLLRFQKHVLIEIYCKVTFWFHKFCELFETTTFQQADTFRNNRVSTLKISKSLHRGPKNMTLVGFDVTSPALSMKIYRKLILCSLASPKVTLITRRLIALIPGSQTLPNRSLLRLKMIFSIAPSS